MSTAAITEPAQYLTFTLDKEVYALEISKVREVLEYSSVTHVPRTPEFMRGVINLRGNVVPIIDLKLKFGMSETVPTIDTCSVIMEVEVDGASVVIGALTDSVREVIELEPRQIEPAPQIGTRLETDFIRGMGKLKDEFVIILDINKIFSKFELAAVRQAESISPESVESVGAEVEADH